MKVNSLRLHKWIRCKQDRKKREVFGNKANEDVKEEEFKRRRAKSKKILLINISMVIIIISWNYLYIEESINLLFAIVETGSYTYTFWGKLNFYYLLPTYYHSMPTHGFAAINVSFRHIGN